MSSSSIETATTTDPQPKNVVIQTTLYDLIASINATIPPEEDHLVIATVSRILDAGRVSFLQR